MQYYYKEHSMQVSFNLTASKIAFKAPKNNKLMNNIQKNNQVSFGISYNSHTKKGKFDKFIQKLGFKKSSKDETVAQVLIRKCDIYPDSELLITQHYGRLGNPIVNFTTFYTDDNGEYASQMFRLESLNEKLSDTQRAAYKIFYDKDTRSRLTLESLNNPFRELNENSSSKEITSTINRVAKTIQNADFARYAANADKIDDIIFSADGKQKIWFNPKNI